jgi:succinyl-diaminopimelate desuccinylase
MADHRLSDTVHLDPVELARDLIRRPSVTPTDAGAMNVLEATLSGLGFRCRRMKFGEIENLYARHGEASPNLCFAGHTDVVPVGDAAAWRSGPFDAEIKRGVLYGRGAVDMKSAIAAFAAAASEALAAGEVKGSLSFLITGDEEGVATHGTVKVVEALQTEGEVIHHCIVGEPSSSQRLGDMIKIGRRGSLNAWITVDGVQGHVAYPDRAANPIPPLVTLLARLTGHRLDDGFPEFQPSNLEVVDLEVGNPATNVIPARASARLNIRFNPRHTGADLTRWLAAECEKVDREFTGGAVTLKVAVSGEAFYTEPGRFVEIVAGAVQRTTGEKPELSTSGGTSDARFIRALCPVVEFGLVGTTMHKVDEQVPVAEVELLARTYREIVRGYFESFRG